MLMAGELDLMLAELKGYWNNLEIDGS
jgi:hypothetical protein